MQRTPSNSSLDMIALGPMESDLFVSTQDAQTLIGEKTHEITKKSARLEQEITQVVYHLARCTILRLVFDTLARAQVEQLFTAVCLRSMRESASHCPSWIKEATRTMLTALNLMGMVYIFLKLITWRQAARELYENSHAIPRDLRSSFGKKRLDLHRKRWH